MKMLDLLRDPVWQFIGAAISFAAIVVSIVMYKNSKQRKELSYEVFYHAPIATLNSDLGEDVEIRFRRKPVPEVHLVAISITNTGNVPILVEDYQRPIAVRFDVEAQVLSVRIAEQRPSNLGAAVRIEAKTNRIEITPVLLNSGWGIDLAVLTSKPSKLKVESFIVGVKEVRNARMRRTNLAAMIGVVVFATLIASTVTALVTHQVEVALAVMLVLSLPGIVFMAVLHSKGYEFYGFTAKAKNDRP